MKTVRDLTAAIQKVAETPDDSAVSLKEIEECLKDGVDPFELYVVRGGDHYSSPFEVALAIANTLIIDKLLQHYRNKPELLFQKLSGNTDNLEDTSVNNKDGSTVREEINFLQRAATSSNPAVLKLICNFFGDDASLAHTKKLAPLVNRPIKARGKRIVTCGLAEYMTFRSPVTYFAAAQNGSLDMNFYKKNPELRDAALAYIKARRFHRAKGGAEPVPPAQLRFVFSHVATFAYLMRIDSIDMEAATAIESAPYNDLLLDVVACAKDSQHWPGCAKKLHIGVTKNEGYIQDGIPFIKVEAFPNAYGCLPIDAVFNCSDLFELAEMVTKHVATKLEQRTRRRDSSFDEVKRKQGALEADVTDIKADLARLVQRMDDQAIAALAAYGEKHSGDSQHSTDSISTGSGKKGSPGKDSPKGNHEEALKKARLDFYCAIRNDLEEKLGQAVSKKGRTAFFHNHNLNLFVTALSYGAYAVAPSGLQGVVAIPIQVAGDWLQNMQAAEKSKHLVCEITAADRSIEAKRKMAILIAWGITASLGEQINLAADKGQLDKFIHAATTEVTAGIKALANAKNANQPNPIGFFQDMVVTEVKGSLKPGKKAGCVVS